MAAKKVTHNVTHVESTTNSKEELLAVTKKNAAPYRIATVILWILGLVCEVFAVLFFTSKLEWGVLCEEPGHTIAWIAALALDLILVVIGSLLWKKANHTDPASKKDKVKFWIQNNLGVIIAAIAFIPFIIISLTDKNASKKDKTMASIIAAGALVVCCLFGIDWNPVSQEEMLTNAGLYDSVYWTESGTVFHAFEDCPHLNHSVNLFEGKSADAVKAGKTRMCKTCQNKLAALAESGETVEKSHDDQTEAGTEENTEADTEADTEANTAE
ncbi:MAG: hypothetical protein KBT31_01465 [Firmicutes bacterium]|nr:hypothetical protein [Candidatus Colimorpha enterica]